MVALLLMRDFQFTFKFFLWQMHDYSGEQGFEDQMKINILGIHKILFSGPESKKKMGVDMENMSARSSSYRS